MASGPTVYAGGEFTSIGGKVRNDLAALDAATGAALVWNPNPLGFVETLALSGPTLYAGGTFKSVGGQPQSYLCAFAAPAVAVEPRSRDHSELSLEGACPNPTAASITVAFALHSQESASLELFDVAGRLRFRREVGSLGPGRHMLTLDFAPRLASELYVLRLVQGSRVIDARVAVIR